VRTTLDLDKPVLEELKALQKREGRTLGELASQILAEGLRGRGRSRVREAPKGFRWRSQPMGAKVNLQDKEAVYRAMGES
jgi:hypothetical protein